MSKKRNLFAELTEGMTALAEARGGKRTLRTHAVEFKPAPAVTPRELLRLRETLNLSRAVFAGYLRTNVRTLENWEQGRAKPNAQAALLIKLVKRFPDTVERLAAICLAIALLSPAVGATQSAPLIRDIASGSHFTLIVKADGTVVGWGRDPDGQAARPVSANRVVPTPIVIDLPGKVLQVAMGDTTQYALLEDGTVVAWGTNDEGQLGNGPMSATGELGRYPKPSITPVQVTGLKDIIQIEAGAKHAVALRTCPP